MEPGTGVDDKYRQSVLVQADQSDRGALLTYIESEDIKHRCYSCDSWPYKNGLTAAIRGTRW